MTVPIASILGSITVIVPSKFVNVRVAATHAPSSVKTLAIVYDEREEYSCTGNVIQVTPDIWFHIQIIGSITHNNII
jgi:hypothetical protein